MFSHPLLHHTNKGWHVQGGIPSKFVLALHAVPQPLRMLIDVSGSKGKGWEEEEKKMQHMMLLLMPYISLGCPHQYA